MLVLKPIAKINSDFTTKFGIPRQSGLVKSQLSTIVFEPEYRDANALRGLEEYSHIWLIWGFSEVKMEHWSPMVKPPGSAATSAWAFSLQGHRTGLTR